MGDPKPSIEVVATDEFVRWWQALPEKEHDAIYDAVSLLEQFGTRLPFPHSSALEGTALPLRELRRKSGKHQLRVIYIFDRVRQAVLLIGGNKLGSNQKLFYNAIIARAEAIWAQYLAEQEAQLP